MFATASLPLLEGAFMPHRKEIPHRRASDADEIINERLKTGAPPNDELLEADMKTTGLARAVDFRIPLVWLLAAVGSFAGFQIMLWASVQKMTESMVKVEAKLETSSAQTVQALIEVNRVKDRVDRVADDYRSLSQQVQQLQQNLQRPR